MEIKMCSHCDREIKDDEKYCVELTSYYHIECYPKRRNLTNRWEKYSTIIWSIFGIVCAIMGVVIGLIFALK